MLYYLYLISLPITFVICWFSYKYLDSNFKWTLPYFAWVIILETANYFNLLVINHSNAWCNNLEELMEFILFTFFITSLNRKTSYNRKIYILAGVIILIAFIDMFFIQGFWKRDTIALILQDLFILSLICIYYHNLLEEAREDLMLLKHPPFLAATGLFFYLLSNAVFYSCFSYMAYKNNYHFLILARTIPGLANLLLNSLLISAFLCFSKTNKLSL